MVTGRLVEATSSRFSFEARGRSSDGVRVTTSVLTRCLSPHRSGHLLGLGLVVCRVLVVEVG
jgi:hypothetical protein